MKALNVKKRNFSGITLLISNAILVSGALFFGRDSHTIAPLLVLEGIIFGVITYVILLYKTLLSTEINGLMIVVLILVLFAGYGLLLVFLIITALLSATLDDVSYIEYINQALGIVGNLVDGKNDSKIIIESTSMLYILFIIFRISYTYWDKKEEDFSVFKMIGDFLLEIGKLCITLFIGGIISLSLGVPGRGFIGAKLLIDMLSYFVLYYFKMQYLKEKDKPQGGKNPSIDKNITKIFLMAKAVEEIDKRKQSGDQKYLEIFPDDNTEDTTKDREKIIEV